MNLTKWEIIRIHFWKWLGMIVRAQRIILKAIEREMHVK